MRIVYRLSKAVTWYIGDNTEESAVRSNSAKTNIARKFELHKVLRIPRTLRGVIYITEPNKMFSVIMPCYNSAEYIKAAVESIINQTFQNWELIAVNDGSSDDTLDILEQFASKDRRIRVFSKENGGYCSAINYGLDRVAGEYFLLMGSDDRLSATLFTSISDALDETCADLIGFRTLRFVDGINEGLDSCTVFDTCVAETNMSIAEFENLHPVHAKIFSVRDTSKCYRTALLGDLRYFGKYGYDADGIFSMLFSHRASSFLSVPVDGYYWTLRKDSLSGRPTTKEIDRDRLENWIKFYNEIGQFNSEEITQAERFHVNNFVSSAKEFSKKISFSDESAIKVLEGCRTYILKLKHDYNVSLMTTFKAHLSSTLFLFSPRLWVFWERLLKKN